MKRIYGDILNAAFLKDAASRAGLRDASLLEDFIMDFELHSILSGRLAACLRGGMAVPFYVDREAVRLSKDIDLFVFEGVESARAKILELAAEQATQGIAIKEQAASSALAHLPMLQYRISYDSVLGSTRDIKADLFCSPELKGVPVTTRKGGTDLRHFATKHDVVLLDHHALIADKMTSLSEATVGYGASRREQFHKQVYDIATLLRALPSIDPRRLIGAYELLAGRKSGSTAGTRMQEFSPGAIITDVADTILALSDLDEGHPSPGFAEGYSEFQVNYLGSMPRHPLTQYADALLIALLARWMLRALENPTGLESLQKHYDQTIRIVLSLSRSASRPAAERLVSGIINTNDPAPDRYAKMNPLVAYLTHLIRTQ